MSNEITEALAELKANYADKLSALQNQLLRLEQKGSDRAESSQATKGAADILRTLRESTGFKAFKSGSNSTGRVSMDGLSLKDALVSDAGQGQGSPASGGYAVLPTHAPGLFGYSAIDNTLIRALPSRPVASNNFTFNRLSGFTAAAAAQAGEAATKAEQAIDTTLIESPVSTIAVHAGISKQLRDDESAILGAVSSLLSSTVRVKAENLLVTGSGTNGEPLGFGQQSTLFVPTADDLADKIGQAQATMTNNGYSASLVLLNPLDWFELQRSKGSDGHYLAGNPTSPMAPSIWGVKVIPTPAVTIGGGYIIDTRWVHVLDRQAVGIEVGYSSDDFVKNIIRVLCEVRLGLAVYDLSAVYRLTVGSP